MCDYGGFQGYVSSDRLVAQTRELLKTWGPEPEISLSALGSFFDDEELPPDARDGVLRVVRDSGSVSLMSVESRADHITASNVASAVATLGDGILLEVGLGLESKDEYIRNVCINKGLSLATFERAVCDIRENGAEVVAHVLLKPPFLSESEAIADATESVEYVNSLGARRIVLMLCNVKEGTLVHWLYSRNRYRAPWLWSALAVAQRLSPEAAQKLLIYGFKCGLPMLSVGHNCDSCTDSVRAAIEDFSGTHHRAILEAASSLRCSCKDEWQEDIRQADSCPLTSRVASFCDEFEAQQSSSPRACPAGLVHGVGVKRP